MKTEMIRDLSDEQFRRLTGVKRETFTRMIEILWEADVVKNKEAGRKTS